MKRILPNHHKSELKYLTVSYPGQTEQKRLYLSDFECKPLDKNNNANNLINMAPTNSICDSANPSFNENLFGSDISPEIVAYLIEIFSGQRKIRGCNVTEEDNRIFLKIEISKSNNDICSSSNNCSNSALEPNINLLQNKIEKLPEKRVIFNQEEKPLMIYSKPIARKPKREQSTVKVKRRSAHRSSRKNIAKIPTKNVRQIKRKDKRPVKNLKRKAVSQLQKCSSPAKLVSTYYRNGNLKLKPGAYLQPKVIQEPKLESVLVEEKNPKVEPIMKYISMHNSQDKLSYQNNYESGSSDKLSTPKRYNNNDETHDTELTQFNEKSNN